MTDLTRNDEAGSRPAAATVPAAAVRAPTTAVKPRFLPTVAVAAATFAVLFEFLAFQLNSGNDPALGASALQVASTKEAQATARPVINRKIIKTKVVHHPPKPVVSGSTVPVSSGSTSSVAPASSSTSAPAPVATPAPAPAPAPAPVTATS